MRLGGPGVVNGDGPEEVGEAHRGGGDWGGLAAVCAFNIAGSLNPDRWDGPHPENLGRDAFDLAVDNAREVIDAVKPKRTKLTYEMMPFCIPDRADCYLRLIEAVDRPAFGVPLDAITS